MAKRKTTKKSKGRNSSPRRKAANKKQAKKKPTKPARSPKKAAPAGKKTKAPKAPPLASEKSAAQKRGEYRRDHAARQSRADSASNRDIGELPPVADPDRRAECLQNLPLFNKTYFPKRYTLPWSDDHLEAQRLMQIVAMYDESFALAMERSCGKTTLCETLAIFAMAGAYHLFIALFGANQPNADAISLSIQYELEENDLLLADFPDICYPIQQIEGIANRAKGQTYYGERTRIKWQTGDVILPSIKPRGWSDNKKLRQFLRPDGYTLCSGAGFRSRGIAAGARGMKRSLVGGGQIRPTMAIVDDPQTEESADSDKQTADRLRIIKRTIRRLAGPGRKTAIMLPFTVLRSGDLADQLLDTDKHPEFHGKRFKGLYSFPKKMDLWEGKYDVLRREGLAGVRLEKIKEGDALKKATAFYKRTQKKMDKGSVVAWPDLMGKGEISGLQRLMNLYLEDRGAFFAEVQNEPENETTQVDDVLKPEDIITKTNGYDRGVVPDGSDKLVAYLDVQARLIYYVLYGCSLDFSGGFLQYGGFPDQRLSYFVYNQARRTLSTQFPGTSVESRVFQGVIATIDQLVKTNWRRADGMEMTIDHIAVDSRYQKKAVFSACRQSDHRSIVIPAQGLYIGARTTPLAERREKSGRSVGPFWYIEKDEEFKMRRLTIDTNAAKAFLHARLGQADGSAGAVRLYGKANNRRIDVTHHQMIADHFGGSEHATKTFGHGRELIEFTQLPNKPDNHLLDCAAGAMALASAAGCSLATDIPRKKRANKKRQRVSYF